MCGPHLFVAAMAALLAVVCLAGCGSGAHHQAAAETAPAVSAPSPSDQGSTSRMGAWLDGAGLRATKRVLGQIKLTDEASHSGSRAAEVAACARLAAVISGAQQAPPIPGARAERYWSLALTNYETGAVDCQAGFTTNGRGAAARVRGAHHRRDRLPREGDRLARDAVGGGERLSGRPASGQPCWKGGR